VEKSEDNPSQLRGPVSLKAESAGSEPMEDDRGSKVKAGKSKL
jgi:hypothetical protein